MTTPAYSELVSAVRREGEGIVSAASLGLDADIPTCEKWDVAALVRHISRLYAYVGLVVSTRATSAPTERAVVPEGEPVAVLTDLLDTLIALLSEMDADTPVWIWSAMAPDQGLFWARRMAHESSVHRFDAQSAYGMVQPIDAELASDGLDELVDVIADNIYGRATVPGPRGSVLLQSSGVGAWPLRLHETGVERLEVLTTPDVVVRGTSSALLLACLSRAPWSALDVSGDADLLDRWTTAMSF